THRGLRVHTETGQGTFPVEVDRTQMDHVLLNLFLNAHQAMPKGGDLTVSVDRCELGPQLSALLDLPQGDYVRITVKDTGEGMDEQTMMRIFDPFFTTRAREGGTGLGLASVYGIVKNHGGTVTVTSAPGKGSEFTVYLPVSRKPLVMSTDRDALGARAGTVSGCLLLIDDDEMILEVASEMLTFAGFDVVTAHGGLAGLEYYRAFGDRVDLVILDMVMPDMSGAEVFEKLREMDPTVKVLLSSGYTLNNEAKDIMEKGCNGFIQKPYKIEEITSKINDIFSRIPGGETPGEHASA
ncbi:MAG TPA: ATP-binding protein, partial [Deltaproteobacteria bacterium]|nr:ATP-binding protein [Deltaproteobacteria bacterium]